MVPNKSFFSGVREGFTFFGECITTLVNSILLAIVYLIGVGLTSLVSRLFRKSFIDLGLKPKSESYWIDASQKKRALDDNYRQF